MKIKTIKKRLGGPVKIAAALGITHGAVSQWKQVPVGHCRALEAWSGGVVTCEDMRPDIFVRRPKPAP